MVGVKLLFSNQELRSDALFVYGGRARPLAFKLAAARIEPRVAKLGLALG